MRHNRDFICTLCITFTLLATTLCSEAIAQEIKGTAFAHDGDDVVVNGTRVRLHGVDAFELEQTCEREGNRWACGYEAKRVLDELVASKEVRCVQAQATQSHGRPVVRCYVGDVEVNAELVRLGVAFDCFRYSRGRYQLQEAQAKETKQGAWQGTFMWPWTWKNQHYCHRGDLAP